MKRNGLSAMVVAAILAAPLHAQQTTVPDLGEVIVSASRGNARFALLDRPVIGLRRQADSAVAQLTISSDSRDAEVRKREIHAMLLAALDRANAAGVELVTGNFALSAVTRTSYLDLPMYSAGRVDTNKVDVMVKVKLVGALRVAEERIKAFVKTIPRSGRGAVDSGGLTLTIINPDQYRDTIIKLVAEDVRRNASVFGPEYAAQVTGVDGQILWSQVSATEVFLYVPYRYTIAPK